MRCGVQSLRTLDNGLPMRTLSGRDFLFPDADEKYVPAVLAYIHDTDVETLNRLLYTRRPEEVVATFPYLSGREKKFACRALFDQWAERLAAGGRRCCLTSWNGWRGKGSMVTRRPTRPTLSMRSRV